VAAIVNTVRGASPAPALRVLLYHRIANGGERASELMPYLITASPAVFERQLRHLARAYHPVGADEVLAAIAGRHVLPPRAALVTFDDGYCDFDEVAWPLLKAHRIPAVLFVATAFVDQPARVFWWDELWQMLTRTRRTQLTLPGWRELDLESNAQRREAAGALDGWMKTLTPAHRTATLDELQRQLEVRPEPTGAVLSWAELRHLREDGVTIAAHTRTHEILDQVDAATLRQEVAGSRDDMVREMGSCPSLFAYPNGNVSAPVVRELQRAGFHVGLTTTPGVNYLRTLNPYVVRRDPAGRSLLRLATKLLGPVGHARAIRHPLPVV
jgi:peptidoglycan/xylan/chitin deacetylase (PgdA/CDA1 family)